MSVALGEMVTLYATPLATGTCVDIRKLLGQPIRDGPRTLASLFYLCFPVRQMAKCAVCDYHGHLWKRASHGKGFSHEGFALSVTQLQMPRRLPSAGEISRPGSSRSDNCKCMGDTAYERVTVHML